MSATNTSDLDFFNQIPWCQKLLNDFTKTQDFVIRRHSTNYDQSTGEDTLIGKTLNTTATLNRYLIFYRRPSSDGQSLVSEVRALLYLGPDLNGVPGVCHGGMIATIMDEVMSMLAVINRDLGHADKNTTAVTAYLNTKYLKAVETSEAVMVTAKSTKIDGRKYFTEAALTGSDGQVLAAAEALFVRIKSRGVKL